jgi:biotin carboxyl carrier protein
MRQIDPRAVRVGIAAGSARGAMDPIVVERQDGLDAFAVDGEPSDLQVRWLDAEHILLGGQPDRHVLLLPPTPAATSGVVRREVVVDGWRFEFDVESAARAALRERATRNREAAGHSGPTEVRAIIPGVVVAVAVAVGDHVVAGQELLAIEAMKMQNELRAPRDGTIERVAAAPGQTIDVGDLLVVIG